MQKHTTIKKPTGWRTGQTIFNFLQWLQNEKGISGNQNRRMADPFNMSDDDWDMYYGQYLMDAEKHQHVSKL